MSFFQKARDRAQEAAAQFQQSVATSYSNHSGNSGGAGGGGVGAPTQSEGATQHRGSFNMTKALPSVLRHGISSIDPRYEHNRSFHVLSGRIKSTQIEHETLARQTKGMASATYQWGQDQLVEKREDSVGDEALADVSDRLAYMLSLIGDLHLEHSKRVEETRADLKRIQTLEVELAPRRALRIKIHKELMTLLPERAMAHSEKIAPLEERLRTLEQEDKEKEEELGKLKREALVSSFDGHFDSLIELGERTALVARYGKLLLQQLPIYAPPFPTPRASARSSDESVWPNEARVAAIRAAVEPALDAFKPDLVSLPPLPSAEDARHLSRNSTIKFAESNKDELEAMQASQQEAESTAVEGALSNRDSTAGSGDHLHPSSLAVATDIPAQPRRSSSSSSALLASPLPEGGSLPPNLNLEPTVLRDRTPSISSGAGAAAVSPPAVPPRSPFGSSTAPASSTQNPAPVQSLDVGAANEGEVDAHSAALAVDGPTFAETGSPIYSTDPGPKSGVLSPRAKGPPAERMPMPPLPPALAAAALRSPGKGSSAADDEALTQKEADEQRFAEQAAVSARLRRDGSIVRRGDPDWERAQEEQLPPYSE